jgi:hypothetical protein
MAECQVLYGITMQKRGVSSRIAVSLHEVDGFQEGGEVAPADRAGVPERGGVARRVDPALQPRIAGEEQVGFN